MALSKLRPGFCLAPRRYATVVCLSRSGLEFERMTPHLPTTIRIPQTQSNAAHNKDFTRGTLGEVLDRGQLWI